MFWKGNNLQPPVSPGIRRKNCIGIRDFFSPEIFSRLLAEIIPQAEEDGLLLRIPSHNNHPNERQQTLTTHHQIDVKPTPRPLF